MNKMEVGKEAGRAFGLFTLILALAACGGGGSSGASNDFTETPEDTLPELEVLELFEGSTHTISASQFNSNLSWQQIDGPAVHVEQTGGGDYRVTVPWIVDGPVTAEVRGLSGDVVTARLQLNIRDRRYWASSVRDENSDSSIIHVRYIAEGPGAPIFSADTIALADLPDNLGSCRLFPSSTGQYIAFSLSVDEGGINPVCRGIYLVDVGSGELTTLSRLDNMSERVEVDSEISWSPDGKQLSYQGSHQNNERHYYLIDVESGVTSYANHGAANESNVTWGDSSLFPIDDGGNPYIEDDAGSIYSVSVTWLKNGAGFGFVAGEEIGGDNLPYAAGLSGQVTGWTSIAALGRPLIRSVDPDTPIDCVNEELLEPGQTASCTVILPNANYESVERRYGDPVLLSSSIDGQLAMLRAMIEGDAGNQGQALIVAPALVEGSLPARRAIAMAFDVYDYGWSPVENFLAYSGGDDRRRRFAFYDEGGLQSGTAPATSGELYLHRDFGLRYRDFPRQQSRVTVDDFPVRKLLWSEDGRYIAFGRAQDSGVEIGRRFSSLWVRELTDVSDDFISEIDNATNLLTNLRGSDDYIHDFFFAPDGRGAAAVIVSDSERRVHDFSREDGASIEGPQLNRLLLMGFFPLAFSGDSSFFAYLDQVSEAPGSAQQLYIQPTGGGDLATADLALEPGDQVLFAGLMQFLNRSPFGNGLLVPVRRISGDLDFYLVNSTGYTEDLNGFFVAGQRIETVSLH